MLMTVTPVHAATTYVENIPVKDCGKLPGELDSTTLRVSQYFFNF